MMSDPVYLDYNATAPLLPSVTKVMGEALSGMPKNPSSIHSYGRSAKAQLEKARETIAHAVSAFPNEVIFTASGTEANMLALKGFPDRQLVASPTEHSSIHKPAGRLGAVFLDVDQSGLIDRGSMRAKLEALGKPALISVMLANNETGVIQPIKELGAIAKEYGALIHCDASQAIGKIPVDWNLLGVDMLTLCAHKAGGPLGVGALILRNDLPIAAQLIGGGQELGRRAGTENVAAILGFQEMIIQTVETGFAQMTSLREWLDAMEAEMIAAVPDAMVVGQEAARLPNTSCVIMPGVSSETQLMNLDLAGYAVSAGSACSSGRIATSHVLKAMGYSDDQAASALRISLGWGTKEAEVKAFTEEWLKLYARLGKKAA